MQLFCNISLIEPTSYLALPLDAPYKCSSIWDLLLRIPKLTCSMGSKLSLRGGRLTVPACLYTLFPFHDSASVAQSLKKTKIEWDMLCANNDSDMFHCVSVKMYVSLSMLVIFAIG